MHISNAVQETCDGACGSWFWFSFKVICDNWYIRCVDPQKIDRWYRASDTALYMVGIVSHVTGPGVDHKLTQQYTCWYTVSLFSFIEFGGTGRMFLPDTGLARPLNIHGICQITTMMWITTCVLPLELACWSVCLLAWSWNRIPPE
jgi:hypothetical protein